MANICAVCNKDLDTQVDKIWYPISDIRIHDRCNNVFKQDPERYGGVNADLDFGNKEAEKTLSTWLPKDNIGRILMLFFFLVGLCSFFTPYEWLFFSFLITSFFSPRLRDWGDYERNNRIDSGGSG